MCKTHDTYSQALHLVEKLSNWCQLYDGKQLKNQKIISTAKDITILKKDEKKHEQAAAGHIDKTQI